MKILKSMLALAVLLLLTHTARAEMKFHVINVGQAESLLIELPHHAILVDAGGEDDEDIENHYRDFLMNYLKSFFARRDDLGKTFYGVIVSHPHKDHTRYLKDVFDAYTIQHFIEGGNSSGSGIDDLVTVRTIVKQKGINHIKVKHNTVNSQALGSWVAAIEQSSEARIRFLSGRRGCQDENNDSLVMRIEYGQKSVLLTGDSEVDDLEYNVPGEGCGGLLPYLLFRYKDELALLDADIYKVGHHGSRNGTYGDFARAVSPEIAVISAGDYRTRSEREYNSWFFGHPNEAAIKVLEAVVTTNRTPITAYTMKWPKNLIENRKIEKAIYCTCWDSNLVFTFSGGSEPIRRDP